MRRFYTFLFFNVTISSLIININAQQFEDTDSLLIKHYWNKFVLKSSTSIKNILYSGIDNYIQLVFPDKESMEYQYYVTTNNGMVTDMDEGFLTIPQNAGRSFFTIYLVTDSQDTLQISKFQFAVQNVPLPKLQIGKQVLSENVEIDRRVFFIGEPLKLHFTDDIPESKDWYTIQSFSIGYMYGSTYKSIDNDTEKLSEETITFINNIFIGRDVFIKVNTISPTSILRYLPIIKFKFIN